MLRKSFSPVLAWLLLFSGCAVKMAPRAVLEPNASVEGRRAQLAQYRITWEGDLISGALFGQGGQEYRLAGVENNLKLSPAAARNIASGKSWELFGHVFATGGGFCFGYYVGGSLQGGDPSPVLLGIGGGALILAMLFVNTGYSRYKTAITQYNRYLEKELDVTAFREVAPGYPVLPDRPIFASPSFSLKLFACRF